MSVETLTVIPRRESTNGRPRPAADFALAVRSARLRQRVQEALEQSGIRAQVVDDPEQVHAAAAALTLVDAEFVRRAPHGSQDGPLWVLCEGADDCERFQLLAAGAERVVDVDDDADLERALANARDRSRAGVAPRLSDFESRSPRMQAVLEMARRLADAPSPILLTGETGSGKEHLARAVHAEGSRAARPFVSVNCGALPDALLESQLFGHVKGSFTGADRDHQGFFQAARGGTILLDEVGEMPQHLQVALLNVLEQEEVIPVGGTAPVPIDVRVIAATNRDLGQAIEEGSFRADLYYRLNVVHLEMPNLRDRREDIPDLAGRALSALRPGRPDARTTAISGEALQALQQFSWPGNVRELRNVIERAVMLGNGDTITLDDLPESLRAGEPQLDEPAVVGRVLERRGWLERSLRDVREAAVEEVERLYLSRALEASRGRIAKTAAIAGIGPRSLYDKMKRYGLNKEDFKDRS